MKRRVVRVGKGRVVPTVEVEASATNLDGLAQQLNLPSVQGAVAMVGGAAVFDERKYKPIRERVTRFCAELTVLAIEFRLAIVDGGTQSGVIRLMGEAYQRHHADFPLVGVVPKHQVLWRDYLIPKWLRHLLGLLDESRSEKTALEPNHSAFVLVNVTEWGGEVEILASLPHHLGGNRVLEILVNGGEISKRDVTAFLNRGGQLLVLEGTGRLADAIAEAIRRGTCEDAQIQAIINTGRVHVFSVEESPAAFDLFIRQLLGLSV